MINRKIKKSLLVALLTVSSLRSFGCVPEAAGIAGLIGFWLGRTTAPTVTTQECTLNGLPVDCSTVN